MTKDAQDFVRADRREAKRQLKPRQRQLAEWGAAWIIAEELSPDDGVEQLRPRVKENIGEAFSGSEEARIDEVVDEEMARIRTRCLELYASADRVRELMGQIGELRAERHDDPDDPMIVQRILAHWDEAKRLDDWFVAKVGRSRIDDRPGEEEWMAAFRPRVASLVEEKREAVRASSLAARPKDDVQSEHKTCAESGCPRGRVFFDADGAGYCKRHGNERGLRPHGKVT